MTKTQFEVLSSDGVHTLKGVVYVPDGEACGFFHIVHGKTEHIGRYDKIMCDMARNGFITFGYDNLGHGLTAKEKGDFGFIAEKGGFELLAQDVKGFSDAVMEKYKRDDNPLPYYLMGHSMGSFITRYAVSKYVKPDKFIIMGTGGKNSAAGVGIAVTDVIKFLCGEKHYSRLLDFVVFGNFNERFGGGTKEDPAPWLSNDEAQRKKFYNDDLCQFKFSVSAMGDLIRLNKLTNAQEWFDALPKSLPILLVSGENDPVGNYGEGVRQVAERLQKNGINAKCIIYPNARHEILNDSTYEQVKNDILDFLKA